MKRGYKELVGLKVSFSKIAALYSLTHYYRWTSNGKQDGQGTLRGYDMDRHIPVDEILDSFRQAYAPAILSIWQLVTKGCTAEYYQFQVRATPLEMKFDGLWHHWAEK